MTWTQRHEKTPSDAAGSSSGAWLIDALVNPGEGNVAVTELADWR